MATRNATINPYYRDAEHYGEMTLSVQASEIHYSIPKERGMPISEYEAVEIGFFRDKKSGLGLPSSAGVEGFDHLFERDCVSPVAPHVSQSDLAALRAALAGKVSVSGR